MKIGDLEIIALRDGLFRLDGGSMFGVVPKTLWSRKNPGDERNRIRLSTTNLLVRTPAGETVVIDDGCGGKWDEKHADIYGIEREGRGLVDQLAGQGVEPGDVDRVCLTHLHFDHAGGTTVRDDDGTVRPTFPEARHVVPAENLAEARDPTCLNRASYMPENWEPVAEAGLLEPLEGDEVEVTDGITHVVTHGHCRGHSMVRLDSGGETLLFMADMVPTWSHVGLPWIMGYDLFPTQTLEVKTDLLERAAADGWVLCAEHDPRHPFARVEKEGPERFRVEPLEIGWGE